MECTTFSSMLLGKRQNQQDCIFDGTRIFQTDFLTRKNRFSGDKILLAVCDGLGGHEGGEKASRFVCERLALCDWDKEITGARIKEYLAAIQSESFDYLPRNSGSTVAGLFVTNSSIMAFNAGDSRIYRITQKSIDYISHDHSLVQGLIDRSMIKADVASKSPLRNLIEFGIGPVFISAWETQEIHIRSIKKDPSAWYLLCSDGLMEKFADPEIHNLLMPDPILYGPRLFNALRANPPRDNTSFIIAKFDK